MIIHINIEFECVGGARSTSFVCGSGLLAFSDLFIGQNQYTINFCVALLYLSINYFIPTNKWQIIYLEFLFFWGHIHEILTKCTVTSNWIIIESALDSVGEKARHHAARALKAFSCKS